MSSSTPTSQPSPSRGPGPGSIASIPMTYSMDTAGSDAYALPATGTGTGTGAGGGGGESGEQLASAYAFQRSERTHRSGGGDRSSASYTTEDSIDPSMADTRSVDYTEDMSTRSGGGTNFEGQQQQAIRQQQMGAADNKNNVTNEIGHDSLNQYYQYQEAQEGYNDNVNVNVDNESYNDLNLATATVNEYQAAGVQGYNNNGNNNSSEGGTDATSTIYQMHKKLLHLLSTPELFHEALDWQESLDQGFDPSSVPDTTDIDVQNSSSTAENKNESALTTFTFDTDFEDDSTFQGLGIDDTNTTNDVNGTATTGTTTKATQNETFEFNPNQGTTENNNKKQTTTTTPSKKKQQPEPKRKEAPLPHQIFAPDAEVVLPQALTASQLFGIERITGIELEAAAGVTGLSQLFLRWLALMPEGDHMNVIDPPGLTVMKISGGGYRVTGAHRVVWRWMNKFSPNSTGQSANDTDFDFGDLVTMTIIDVFETDVNGKLLSYCPTFDNRAVHKTPEMAERLRKGATQFKETMEVVAKSPVGKNVGRIHKMSFRAAMVVGNAVKNKIQQQQEKNQREASMGGGGSTAEEEQLNELLQSQIATDETSDVNITVNATGLEEDPTSSPSR